MTDKIELDLKAFSVPDPELLAQFRWQHIANEQIRTLLIEDEQMLAFAIAKLKKIRSSRKNPSRNSGRFPTAVQTLRAGQIREIIRLTASMAEACLWDHALQRGIHPKREDYYSLGGAIQAWKTDDDKPAPELKKHWRTLQEIKGLRNHIHPFKRSDDPRSNPMWLIENESRLLKDIGSLMVKLQGLQSD